MKIKPLNDIEKSIEDYVVNARALTYSVHYTGTHDRDNRECDGWRFTIKDQSFEYFTGVGLREEVTADTKRRAAFDFPGLTEKDAVGQTLYGRRYLQRVQELRKPQTPPIAGLLYSLILDSSACNESFSAWCDSLGYNTDSRKALKLYEQCQQGFDKLCKVFTAAQIEHITGLLGDY